MHIYKDDMVVVLSGANVGDRGRVISVNRENETVIVEGVHTIHKHVKKSKRNPQGGRLTKEMPVPQSKVQVICPACGKPARFGVKVLPDGSKYRSCKKCNARLSQISPAKTKK